jgi:amino acid adenylation domain-containing protein
LSFAQERLWFLSHLEPGGSEYNVPLSMEIEGPLCADAMEKALNALVARHEILRTKYLARDGVPYQEIATEGVVQLDQRDLSGLDDDGLWRWMVDECERPFNLEADGALRAYLLRRGPSRHVLLLNVHHIAFDGWSLGILKHELSVYYRAFLTGIPLALPPLPMQCADFAEWQRKELSRTDLDAQVEYWRTRLTGAEALAFPRRQNAANQSGREPVDLPSELAARLYEVCRREGVTLFMLLLASFQALLSRYTGQTDISVGAPVANRDPIETEKLIGFFVNTLVFRQDLSGGPSFRDLLARVRETVLDALSSADVPFERVVEILQPERSVNGSPLFQAMLALQPAGGRLEIPGARVTNLPAPQENAKFDLLLALEEEDGWLKGALNYSREVFTPAGARRFVAHFRNLLEVVLETPDCPISRLPILTEDERRILQMDWSRSSGTVEYPSVLRTFQQIAAEAPERLAVVSEGTAVTYGELDDWSNAIASELQCCGVARQSIVGVLLERSAEAIAACLGTLKAGCAYLPLEPAHPDERLALLLADSGTATVLTTAEGSARLARLATQTIDIRHCTAVSAYPSRCDAQPDEIAYVLYTSGSTGKPKGIPVTHRGLWNTVDAVRREIGFTEDDVMPALTTFAFDIAALDVFLPLSSGGRVTVVPPGIASDGEQLSEFLRSGGITVAQATPATWQMLIDSGWPGGPSLKVLSGGEAMSRKLADALLDRAQAVWNLYGPTETTIYATGYRVRRETGPPPIGRPLQNTRVYVLDRFLQPAPIGTPGELYIGGAGVARGYLNRPELTRAHFVDDPCLSTTGGLFYRTGDLVRWREDGELEFLGRMDDQLKIRGFRVEPAEVEAALMGVPGVRQAAVVVRERSEQDRALIGYAALDAGCTVAPQEIQRHLRHTLPDYMVPSGIRVLESLPLGGTGKIDRKALAALPWGGPEGIETPPRTPLEILIARLWSDLFDTPVTGTEANFFSLGGHSLLAVRLVSRLRKAAGVPIPVKLVFQFPTIGELALAVAQLQAESLEEAELAKLLDEIEGGSTGRAAGGPGE